MSNVWISKRDIFRQNWAAWPAFLHLYALRFWLCSEPPLALPMHDSSNVHWHHWNEMQYLRFAASDMSLKMKT